MRIGLLTKFALALAVVGLVPVAIVVVQLISLNRDAMTTQVLRTHALAARTSADRIGAFVSTLEVPIRTASERPEFRAQPGSPEAQALLAEVLQAQPAIIAVEVTDKAGSRAYLLQRRDHSGAVEPALAAGELGQAVVVAADGSPWFRLDSELPNADGWVRIIAAATPLMEAVSLSEMGADAELAVLDRTADRVWLEGGASGAAAYPPTLRAAARSRTMSGSGTFGDILGAFAPVPGRDWVVMTRQPLEVAEALVTSTRRRGLMAALTAAILALLFSAVAYGSVVRPIRELLVAQRELIGDAGGDVAGNEFDELRRSFAILAQKVRERASIEDLTLGRYKIRRVLGEGSMGTVFLGWDPKLEREVAIKTIKLSAELPDVKRDEIVRLLLKEARVIASVNHPNIVAVYDVEDAPEAPFVAMEYVEGVALSALISQRGRLDDATAVHVGLGVARGLEAAHAHGIVHHDIKPGNILVRADGTIKIMDFGIAEVVSALAERRSQVFGTPGYLPPETLKGKGTSPQGDVYALGVSLYECLAGRRPYGGESLRAILMATIAAKPQPLHALNPAVSPALVVLIQELMHPTPEGRAPSARVARERLEAVGASVPNRADTAAIPVGEIPLQPAPPQGEHRTRVMSVEDLETQAIVKEFE